MYNYSQSDYSHIADGIKLFLPCNNKINVLYVGKPGPILSILSASFDKVYYICDDLVDEQYNEIIFLSEENLTKYFTKKNKKENILILMDDSNLTLIKDNQSLFSYALVLGESVQNEICLSFKETNRVLLRSRWEWISPELFNWSKIRAGVLDLSETSIIKSCLLYVSVRFPALLHFFTSNKNSFYINKTTDSYDSFLESILSDISKHLFIDSENLYINRFIMSSAQCIILDVLVSNSDQSWIVRIPMSETGRTRCKLNEKSLQKLDGHFGKSIVPTIEYVNPKDTYYYTIEKKLSGYTPAEGKGSKRLIQSAGSLLREHALKCGNKITINDDNFNNLIGEYISDFCSMIPDGKSKIESTLNNLLSLCLNGVELYIGQMHGDYKLENLIFVDDAVYGAFDFDLFRMNGIINLDAFHLVANSKYDHNFNSVDSLLIDCVKNGWGNDGILSLIDIGDVSQFDDELKWLGMVVLYWVYHHGRKKKFTDVVFDKVAFASIEFVLENFLFKANELE